MNIKQRILLFTSVTLNLVVVLFVVGVWARWIPLLQWYFEGRYAERTSLFAEFPVQEGDVVFLGDSITERGPWADMFRSGAVRNHGIGGDTTAGVLKRLDLVTRGRPEAVFLLIGTNDLTKGPDDRTVSYKQYQQIVKRLKRDAPSTKIFLQSLLPRSKEFRSEVEDFNAEIERIALEEGATFLDIYSPFLDEDGSMMNRFSDDEVHLLSLGYTKWRDILRPEVGNILASSNEKHSAAM